ncbi:hypothetical protein BN14_11281 [Rhizoctonia solani AG-1 IB]|uniref:Uncharacterized protein n=1 Tax=Thanatephorus cucumeris (strain AG1-IB / isolate 7/3/14) TaxID=1108050 RepID=M5CDE7_THACB|nr:hypothetical protein BN14_11281 [Rhizoctonia solani AG-1 IB]
MLAHRILVFVGLIAGIVRAGNTTCKTTSLDWYTRSVGETPCRTYERMRQICDRDYQVGDFRTSIPGDNCGGQPATCCCNSVSFALSMLCMNCQHGVGSGLDGDNGYDARAGTYGLHLDNCSRIAFKQHIFWSGGDWYYRFNRETAQSEISDGKNDTGVCPAPSLTVPTVSGTGTIAPTAAPTSSESNTPVGAIAGGVVGGVVALATAVLLGFFISRRRRNRGVIDLTEEKKTPSPTFDPYNYVAPSIGAQPVAVTPYPTPASSSTNWTSTTGSPPPTQAPSSRHTKPGIIAASPPSRAEIYQSRPLLPTGAGSSSYPVDRHKDSEGLTNVFGLGRSASGRLPPSYQARD